MLLHSCGAVLQTGCSFYFLQHWFCPFLNFLLDDLLTPSLTERLLPVTVYSFLDVRPYRSSVFRSYSAKIFCFRCWVGFFWFTVCLFRGGYLLFGLCVKFWKASSFGLPRDVNITTNIACMVLAQYLPSWSFPDIEDSLPSVGYLHSSIHTSSVLSS